jgi:hypothetical protein
MATCASKRTCERYGRSAAIATGGSGRPAGTFPKGQFQEQRDKVMFQIHLAGTHREKPKNENDNQQKTSAS